MPASFNDWQVGQTGKIVAPKSISPASPGNPAHGGHEGWPRHRRHQQDEEAPIFQVADYGIVGDLFKWCRNW
jgi:electron transfer flavoprotein alpha subunit